MVEQLNLVDHGVGIAKEAFRILLSDATPLSTTVLAERTGADKKVVKRVLDNLKLVGRAEIQGDVLLGVYGLTLNPTQHQLKLRGSRFFTWCAFDIVGIPAALRESAEISSECAYCRSAIRFAITKGEPPSLSIVISWLAERCDSIRNSSVRPSTSIAITRTTSQR